MSRLRNISIVLLLAAVSASLAYSQAVNGTLLGTITDVTTAVLVNGKVTIAEGSTGVSRSTQTNDSGNYSFPNLPPGRYRVTVEMAGAWPGHEGFEYLPVNFQVGGGVTLEGTIGHVKSVLDSMLRRGEPQQVIWMKGTPTIMAGDVEDPDSETHLKEGPYVVFDDAARPECKNHPEVCFAPGHPVLRMAMPRLMKGMGVRASGKTAPKGQQFERGMHNLEYGSALRKAATVAKPAAAMALAVAGIPGATALARKL